MTQLQLVDSLVYVNKNYVHYPNYCLCFPDLKNPKTNHKSAGFTPQEREGMTQLLEQGFVDTFRHLNPDKEGAFTFWNYLGNCRSRNTGWYVLSDL